ncbi:MAG: mandelate racemase/muconate lactonizing enzyme family protein [Planctomycetota bacterium]|nr:mandelate racemase/muconate lactonizing enzyme family protein [Planctomycetota bacterium]MDA1212642.1 mandelate racemase/muconate lactonizing enzyme family protein [Planctomycetota bacterium]
MSKTKKTTTLNRRDLLGTLGATVGGMMVLNHAVAQENNPAEHVADSASEIRLTEMRTHLVQHKVYVELMTNMGVTGWGEVSALVPTAAEVLARKMFDLLKGENPTRIEFLWQKLFRAHRDMRGGPFMSHTIAGIDMALWDLTGKLWGVPVYRLLGGPCRDKVKVYPTSKSHKVPPHGVYGHAINPDEVERMVNAIKRTRDQVGPDGTVMFDAHCAVPPAALIQLAAAVKAYDVLFMEEVAVPGNIEVFKRLKAAIDIPLATGERDHTIWEFIPYLHEAAIDVLQPDVAHCGGITQMKKIAVLAEAYHVPLAPHCTTSPLGATASLSVGASIPFLLIHETAPGALKWGEQFMNRPWSVDDTTAYATLPDGPGLGVTFDVEKMQAIAADPNYEWKWPEIKLEDGSIADY